MITMLRRLFWLALLGGAGYAVWAAWQHKQAQQPAPAPQWPPVDPPGPAPAESGEPSEPTGATAGFADVPTDESSPAEPGDGTDAVSGEARSAPPSDDRRWVDPLDDGGCPDGYQIKANDNSGIFHVPGGRFYDRTGAERCYARAEDAEADGYRAAKS